MQRRESIVVGDQLGKRFAKKNLQCPISVTALQLQYCVPVPNESEPPGETSGFERTTAIGDSEDGEYRMGLLLRAL